MKKLFALIMALAMAVSLVACGGGNSTPSGNTSSGDTSNTAAASGDTIRLVNGKIEIDAALKNLAAKYKEETGVTVEIESMGGGVDIQGTLKGYYQAGNMPDIFVNNGTDFDNWTGMLVDMKDQAWVSDTQAAYKDDSGAVIGFPYTTEAIGLAYNASILEAAGVDPATLTSPDAIKAAFETIDSKKADLGLNAVVGYCAEASSLYWSTGNHLFANYIDGGLDRDDTTYIDLLSDGGQLDEARMTDFANFVDLLNQYSDPSLLVSGTYDQQILNFSSGKYAFVTQGSWIGATMTSDDADAYAAAGNFKCGMVPYAFQAGQENILTSAPSYWSVFGEGNTEAALAFLDWCATDAGQEILVMEANCISPFESCTFVANDPFAQTISDYISAGKTSNWHWSFMKEGLAQNYTGQVFADFAAGNLDAASFVSTMQQVCAACYNS